MSFLVDACSRMIVGLLAVSHIRTAMVLDATKTPGRSQETIAGHDM
ncbi:hypothetical protein [Mycobacterium holsaticum]